jgi:hypothetical protein
VVNPEKLQQLEAVLRKVEGIADEEGLPQTKATVDSAIRLLGYEATGFRIPRCTECMQPVADVDRIQKINRDRR